MARPLVIANWKMYLTRKESLEFCRKLSRFSFGSKIDLVLAPSFTALSSLSDFLSQRQKRQKIYLGAQDVFWEEKGAFTGEVSPIQLTELGVKYVILGHSERRRFFGEIGGTIRKKMLACFRNRLVPVICLGESQEEREKGLVLQVLRQQIREIFFGLKLKEEEFVLAYEPVWAIGSGKTPLLSEISAACQYIQKEIRKYIISVYEPKILYGGSVDELNILNLVSLPEISGFLIGGASANQKIFLTILKVLAQVKF